MCFFCHFQLFCLLPVGKSVNICEDLVVNQLYLSEGDFGKRAAATWDFALQQH